MPSFYWISQHPLFLFKKISLWTHYDIVLLQHIITESATIYILQKTNTFVFPGGQKQKKLYIAYESTEPIHM